MMTNIIKALISYSLFILCSLFTYAAYASPLQAAYIGFYNSEGEIALISQHLQQSFPDGRAIDAISVVEENSFLFLARKARDEDSCEQETIQLVDFYGTPLVVGSDPLEGSPVFIRSNFQTNSVNCEDNGCLMLEGLQLADSPEITGARCDITALSQHRCACHIRRGFGPEVVKKAQLCQREVTLSQTNLDDWSTVSDEIKEIPQ